MGRMPKSKKNLEICKLEKPDFDNKKEVESREIIHSVPTITI
jgi:hypothetical protein